MNPERLKKRNLETEIIFSTSRSSGPGGQNVNKVESKAELRFNIFASSLLSDKEKEIIGEKLKNRINKNGVLLIVSQSESSQQMNKRIALEKFYNLIAKALTIPKLRKSTVPTVRSKLDRLETKRKHGSIKKTRKGPEQTHEE
jgi:ribosome-associated protein